MVRTCIVVADSARARFFTLEVPIEPLLDGAVRLVERGDLVNPEAELPEQELFSDRPGRGHASSTAPAHGLDGQRSQHRRERERRHARRVAVEIEQFVARQEATQLLLVAEPRLLGVLREQLDERRLRVGQIVEIPENLSRRSLREIQSSLVRRAAVPRSAPPAGSVFRPRGQHPAQT